MVLPKSSSPTHHQRGVKSSFFKATSLHRYGIFQIRLLESSIFPRGGGLMREMQRRQRDFFLQMSSSYFGKIYSFFLNVYIWSYIYIYLLTASIIGYLHYDSMYYIILKSYCVLFEKKQRSVNSWLRVLFRKGTSFFLSTNWVHGSGPGKQDSHEDKMETYQQAHH